MQRPLQILDLSILHASDGGQPDCGADNSHRLERDRYWTALG